MHSCWVIFYKGKINPRVIKETDSNHQIQVPALPTSYMPPPHPVSFSFASKAGLKSAGRLPSNTALLSPLAKLEAAQHLLVSLEECIGLVSFLGRLVCSFRFYAFCSLALGLSLGLCSGT